MAVINPNKQVLEAWAEGDGIKMDFESLCKDSRTIKYMVGELVKIAKEKKVLSCSTFIIFFKSVILYTMYVHEFENS